MSAIDDRRAEQRKLFEQERDVALIAAVEGEINFEGNGWAPNAPAGVVEAVLTTLAEQFRINGKLLAEQKAKGWKGEVETGPGALLACADRVEEVAKSVRLRAGNAAGLARMAEIRETVVPAEAASTAEAHGWDVDPASVPSEPTSAGDVMAYLRGDTHVMPDLSTGAATTVTVDAGDVMQTIDGQPVHGTVTFSLPVGGVTAEAVAQSAPPPLVTPGGFDDARIRFTLDRIIELGKEAAEARRSHTRGTSYSECGFRYAMRHHEVPAWWNVGGTAFHSFAEDVERGRLVCQAPDVTAWCRAVWESIFDKTIDVVRDDAEHYGVPGPATWRAAKHGKENRDWWRVEGAAMCETYLWVTGRHPSRQLTDADLASQQISGSALMRLPTAPTPAGDGKVMLEFPLSYDIEGVHWQGVIDRVAWDEAGSRLVIIDAKSGDHEPDDPSQLVDYAHVLRRQYSVPDWIKIDGLFYMARKGSVIVYEGLEAIESWESFAYRVKTVDRGIREGIFLPNVGLGCNSCGAKAICPAQGNKK